MTNANQKYRKAVDWKVLSGVELRQVLFYPGWLSRPLRR